ncbi:TonB-dependent receptor [Sphingomonas mesophila]|uniref:TonB-dependent receptor n=1 Tax=Sphingomonas mesophila TaxID=2303576 RepID=UPI001F0865F5|nr:TonB-dependent siderophore receptor [Sphingomonas mesophila]
MAAPAFAAEAAVEAAPVEDEIIVQGERSTYGAAKIVSATKTATAVQDIPQALTIVTKAQIDDQQLRSISELLTFVPGASPATGESNRDQMTLRGNNSTADFFVDGLRDDVQYFRDFYNVARVEVLKGPNAMIFGRGGGGGIVNRVAKRTGFDTARALDLGGDSFGGFRGTLDIDQPLGGALGLRVNALYEKGDSFRRDVELTRYGVNPTLGIALGDESRLDLSYEYFRDRRTTDRGVPSVTDPAGIDTPLTGHDRDFFGDADDSFARAGVHRLSAALEHRLTDSLSLRHRTVYGDYDKFYQNIYPTNLDEAAGEVVLGAYNSTNDRRSLISQTDLVWEGRLGGIDQTLLAGVELGHQSSRNRRLSGSFAGSNRVSLADPSVDKVVTYAAAPSDANNRTLATVAALYVQNQLRPTEWLEIVAGLRLDRFTLEVDDLRASGGEYERTDTLLSPRLGLVVKPFDNLSLYASYSRSFLPQSGDQFGGLDVTSEALKPERFDNLELGAKWQPIDGLLATAAIYRLDRTNTRATDPANPAKTVLSGAQRSTGIEFGLERSITHRWQVSAGYAWQKAEISETTTAAPEGREVPLVPRHSASLWSKYRLTDSFALGLGAVARSKSFASLSNQVKLPGYARLDAAAYYKLRRGVTAQLNVENLLGADYFPAAHNDNNIAPGPPRNAKLTLHLGL